MLGSILVLTNTVQWCFTIASLLSLSTIHGINAITKIWMKIDPYCQRRKCIAETVVCNDIKVMPIFVRWIWGIKWEWGCRKLLFLLLAVFISLQSSYTRPKLLYLSMYRPSPIVAFHRHRNRWPWMTLNSHFALNTVSGWNRLASMLQF